jgi:hypothetical protein
MPSNINDASCVESTNCDHERNDEFVKVYYSELQQDMRWRKEVEFKLITFILTFYTILGGALSFILNSTIVSAISKLLVSFSVCLMILCFTFFIVHRIKQDHKIYNELGLSAKNVWKYAGITRLNILPEKWEKYGTGKGYLFTIRIIWAITLILTISILLIAIFSLLYSENVVHSIKG